MRSATGRAKVGRVGCRASEIDGVREIEELGREKV